MSETTHRQRENAFGLRAAKLLLEIKAVNFRLDDPFILTSGWASPVYIDCRKLISYPKVGHMPPMEIPEKLAYDIKSFLGTQT